MKHAGNKISSRYVLTAGLLLAVGFSVSWNPDHFLISRSEFKAMGVAQEMQWASETAQAIDSPENVGKMNLGAYDKTLKDVQLNFTIIDNDGSKSVRYYLEGSCTDCWRVQAPSISQENFSNMELLQRALAEAAITDLKGEKATVGADVPAPIIAEEKAPVRRVREEILSDCDEEESGDQIRCEQDELITIIDSCSEVEGTRTDRARAKEACVRKAQSYYRKFLQKSLKEGLSAPSSSDEHQAALESRDSLISELGRKFDSTIKQDLVGLSAQGTVTRARARYNAVLGATQNAEQATYAAKQLIQQEAYGSYGMDLCSALAETSCLGALRNPAQRALLESENKYFSMFTENFDSKMSSLLNYQGTSLPFDSVLNGEIPSSVPQITPLATDLYTARTGNTRQSAEPISGTGSGVVPLISGLPAPEGTVSVPSFTQQSGVIENGQVLSPQSGILPMIVPGQTFNANMYNGMTTQSQMNGPNTYNPMNPLGSAQTIDTSMYPQSPGQMSGSAVPR